MTMVSFLMSLYYIIIITWALYYFFASMTSQLPWTTCNNVWNTIACFTKEDREIYKNFTDPNSTWGQFYLSDTKYIDLESKIQYFHNLNPLSMIDLMQPDIFYSM